MTDFDLVVRGGVVVDGSGGAPFEADIAIRNGRIEQVGTISETGRQEINATGKLVTPGFVDIHTHYDGQVTWEDTLAPSSSHGVTTVLMGNCGVGFAPCRPEDRDALMRLMEGVEDLPEPVLSAGVPWEWESFGEYLSFLARRRYDIDIAAQVPHAALRVYAMRGRALNHEPATPQDSELMAKLVGDALRAGALGFSTSRSINHKASDGRVTPSLSAQESELVAIAKALRTTGAGVLQVVTDFEDAEAEMAMLARVCRESARPMSISVFQRHRTPHLWREVMDWIAELNGSGLEVKAQVASRHLGGLFGLELTSNPLKHAPSYQRVSGLPLQERLQHLRDAGLRGQIIAELEALDIPPGGPPTASWQGVYSLERAPDCEPGPECFVPAMASARGVSNTALVYDLLLEHEGQGLLAMPTSNFADGSLSVCARMMGNPYSVMGLSDAGAHVGLLCDAGQPTHLLSYWARDRKSDRIKIETAVAALSREPAHAVGLFDRGMIRSGLKADLNIIDFDGLSLQRPYVTHDLPAGGRRLRQDAVGYDATIVSGEIIACDGVKTTARPGRLVRGGGWPEAANRG